MSFGTYLAVWASYLAGLTFFLFGGDAGGWWWWLCEMSSNLGVSACSHNCFFEGPVLWEGSGRDAGVWGARVALLPGLILVGYDLARWPWTMGRRDGEYHYRAGAWRMHSTAKGLRIELITAKRVLGFLIWAAGGVSCEPLRLTRYRAECKCDDADRGWGCETARRQTALLSRLGGVSMVCRQ